KTENVATCCCCDSNPYHCSCPVETPPAQAPRPTNARLCRYDDTSSAITQTRNAIEKSRESFRFGEDCAEPRALVARHALDTQALDAGPPGAIANLRTVI